MATKIRKQRTVAKSKRRIVQGIEHGFGGYTNYGCRCKVCSAADYAHKQEYREARFAGNPMCVVPKCPRKQSRAHGYGFCYKHGQEMIELRREHPVKAKRIAKKLGITLKPLPSS